MGNAVAARWWCGRRLADMAVVMLAVEEAVLRDPVRLAAVDNARRAMSLLPVVMDAVAALAARLTETSMAMLSLLDDEQEHLVGAHAVPTVLTQSGHAPMAYSIGKYAISVDSPVGCEDVVAQPQLRDHPLATRHGVRALLGVPLRDGAGQPVGALTVLDTVSRRWSEQHVTVLAQIAGLLQAGVPAGAMAPAASDAIDSVSLLDSVQEAFLAVNRDGVVVGWNRAAEQLLGYTAEQVLGRHLDDSLLPDYDGKPFTTALTRLFSAAPRRAVTRRVSVRHRDGRRLPARASLSVISSAAGPVAGAFLTDLSGQTAAEEAADRHGSFLAALLESLSVGVIACDERGRPVLVNRVLRQAHGMPPTGGIPADWPATVAATLRHADGTPMSWDRTPLMRALSGELVQDVDVVVQAPGQRLRTFATTAQPITGSDGRLRGAVAAAHEITAMRRVERFRACHLAVAQALAAASDPSVAAPGVLRAVATTLGWPYAQLWLIDRTGRHLQSLGYWSEPGFAELADGTIVKSVGITGRVWGTGEPTWVADIADAGWLHTSQTRTHTRLCQRLGIRTVLSVPVRDGTSMLGVLTCYSSTLEPHHDVLTVLLDGIAAQFGVFAAMCRATALARQLERASDDFLALIGHEMRTPLTSIGANAALLVEDEASLDEDSRDMVRAIERNTTALRGIIDILLDLAGLQAGRVGLTITDVDLAALIAAAVDAAQPTAAANGVRQHIDVPATLPVQGDPARLRQVVDDLLSNAIKYSPDRGEVRIALRSDSMTAELRITDNGIGVPDDEREQLFARFYRARNVRHHGVPGSGLGLSRARTIVDLHGGTITITDNKPAGTAVVVRLPLRDETSPAERRTPADDGLPGWQ